MAELIEAGQSWGDIRRRINRRAGDGRVNIAEFGAVPGQDASDAIDAAMAALGSKGGEIFIGDNYLISRPVLPPGRGIRLVGASSEVGLREAPGFVGDCLIGDSTRATDGASLHGRFQVAHLRLTLRTGITAIDLTGSRHSRIEDVHVVGPGVNVAGSVGVKCADTGPGGAHKSCYFADLHQVRASNLETGLLFDQVRQNAGGIHWRRGEMSVVKYGVWVLNETASTGLMLDGVYMFGNREPGGIAWRGPLGYQTTLLGFQPDLFERQNETGFLWPQSVFSQSRLRVRALHVTHPEESTEG